MDALLSIDAIHTAYGLSKVLFGITADIRQGECVCLLGRNGVGKSTTIRTIMGLAVPSQGKIVWKGEDITGWAPHRIARAGIGFVPEDRRVFAELTVWENLDIAARAARRPGHWTIDALFDLFPQLAAIKGRMGGFLSGGEQQMLTIARTLMTNPDLLLLDEPSEGLAPLVVDMLLEKIADLKKSGLTILLAEQGLQFSLALADRVYVLEKGEVRYTGPSSALRDDKDLADRLLAL